MLMSIAATYNLELVQFNVTNAFVYAGLDQEVYIRMPNRHQKTGTVLRINKALYSLQISPLLWQKEFTTTLVDLGFKVVLHKPCCLIKKGIIIFFYVDNIIIAYSKTNKLEAN
jgi:hypothetical protein